MTLPGETIATGAPDHCCGKQLEIQVLRSNLYYIGTFCPNCGPYSRESGYYPDRESAQAALDSGNFGRTY